jgi:dephospho-CoA kinase
MLIAGLTGNYGMGKSYVLSVFRELGAMVLDSDEIVHYLLQDKKVIGRVKKILGEKIEREDGSIDKKEIAKIIFDNSELRGKLEMLLHKLVFDEIQKSLRKIKGEKRLVVVEVPLLFEGGYQDRFDTTMTVYTTQKAAIERLTKSGISRGNALKRLKAQLPIQIKKKKADFLIDNNGSKRKTFGQVEKIYGQLCREMHKE